MEKWGKDARREAVIVDLDMLVPKDHLLRKIEKVMDYDWLYECLEGFSHVTATFTARDSGSIGLCVGWHTRPSLYGLLCDFYSSVREFAHQRFFR